MWNWLRKLLGLKETPKPEPKPEETVTPIVGDMEETVTPIVGDMAVWLKPEPKPEKDWLWLPSKRKPPSLLELSKRKHQGLSTEGRMPKSFANRPGVKQAQANLGKVGYDPKAKMEEDPPRRKRIDSKKKGLKFV